MKKWGISRLSDIINPGAFSVLSRLKSDVVIPKGNFHWCCGKKFCWLILKHRTLILLFLPVVFWEKPLDSTRRRVGMLISAGGRKKPIHHWEENLQGERKQGFAGTVHGTLLKAEGGHRGLREYRCWCCLILVQGLDRRKEVGERAWQWNWSTHQRVNFFALADTLVQSRPSSRLVADLIVHTVSWLKKQ